MSRAQVLAYLHPTKPQRAPKGTGRTTMKKKAWAAAVNAGQVMSIDAVKRETRRIKCESLERKFVERWDGPEYRTQWTFHPTRRWRLDFAWPGEMVALEIMGGGWVGGAHHRGRQYERDCEKANAAIEMGWRVIRWTAADLDKPAAFEALKGLLT